MRDAKPLRLQRRGLVIALHLLVAVLLLAGVARAQRSPLPPPPLSAIEEQLNTLTNEVAGTISDKFSFCVADP
jgi:hypothetical protein